MLKLGIQNWVTAYIFAELPINLVTGVTGVTRVTGVTGRQVT